MRVASTGLGQPDIAGLVKDRADAFAHGLRRGFSFGVAVGAGVVLAVVAALWLGGVL